MKNNFNNANEAFTYFYKKIRKKGVSFGDTKALFNVGFTIKNPSENIIIHKERNFNIEYAEAEWKWYLSGDNSIDKLGHLYGKIPAIWERMAIDRHVNSNYGYQWERNYQLDYVVAKLRNDKDTRHAAISIYDGKEHASYRKDTPCTYAVQFTILNNKLNMAVLMRSNDLWFGFCVDQYCFSYLQKMVADRLSIDIGTYYHYAHNLHLYNNKIK